MPQQFVKPEVIKPATETVSEEEKKVDKIADKAAKKASHTEQRYDKDHQIFSK